MHTTLEGLKTRLDLCVNRMGGKRALATASGVSEAQLYRYMDDGSAIPAERLMAIAQAAGVDSGWLLTGKGEVEVRPLSLRPEFNPKLMVEIIQAFEELLLEYDKPFTPRQRARAIALMYEALRHAEMQGQEIRLGKFSMLEIVSFLSELRTEEELDLLLKVIELLEYSGKGFGAEHIQMLTAFCNFISRGYRNYYSNYVGQIYFERMGRQLDAEAVRRLHAVVEDACKILKKNELEWLDLGCGNGRHLSHLHRAVPNIRARGLELSRIGMEHCALLEKTGKLASGTAVQGDMREIPFEAESFDVVYSRMVLFQQAYLPGSGLGLEAVFDEVRRVLRPGGIFHLSSLYGRKRQYLLMYQQLNEESLAALAERAGLTLVTFERLPSPSDNGGKGGADYRAILDDAFRATLRKI